MRYNTASEFFRFAGYVVPARRHAWHAPALQLQTPISTVDTTRARKNLRRFYRVSAENSSTLVSPQGEALP